MLAFVRLLIRIPGGEPARHLTQLLDLGHLETVSSDLIFVICLQVHKTCTTTRELLWLLLRCNDIHPSHHNANDIRPTPCSEHQGMRARCTENAGQVMCNTWVLLSGVDFLVNTWHFHLRSDVVSIGGCAEKVGSGFGNVVCVHWQRPNIPPR